MQGTAVQQNQERLATPLRLLVLGTVENLVDEADLRGRHRCGLLHAALLGAATWCKESLGPCRF